MNSEIALRQEAIRRLLAGESQASISRVLRKSRRWVSYWAARYQPDDPEGSLANRSSAPQQPYRRWSLTVIQQALTSRRLRMAADQPGYEYALISAEAIHYELRALGIRPVPSPRTIHYWLKQANLVPPPAAAPETERPTKPYPTPAREQVNDLQQADLKGPFYLHGGDQKHYLLALRDFCSKRVALQAAQNRQAQTIASFLVAAWQRCGLPKILQLDNSLEFRGSNRYPRAFGLIVKLCLDLDIEPLFVPPREPWRNGFIENFNGQAARLLLNRERFADFAQLQTGVARLEQAVNATHRYAALAGQTPVEFVADQDRRLLAADYDGLQRTLQLEKGQISFIRLVRPSGRITLCANDKFEVDPELSWHYVWARVQVQAQVLQIYHQGELIKTCEYLI